MTPTASAQRRSCWKNILWAADPFENLPQQPAVMRALEILVKKCGSRVTAAHLVSAASDSEAPLPPGVVRDALLRWSDTLPIELEEVHVLEARGSEGPARLAAFAQAGGYDLIVLTTPTTAVWSLRSTKRLPATSTPATVSGTRCSVAAGPGTPTR
jgi:hypothetical protein